VHIPRMMTRLCQRFVGQVLHCILGTKFQLLYSLGYAILQCRLTIHFIQSKFEDKLSRNLSGGPNKMKDWVFCFLMRVPS
jgi:hypothetical protein